jgi:nucleoside-diphosphate-sugar epimerase
MSAELRARGWTVRGCDIVAGCDALKVFADSTLVWDLVVHAAAVEPHRAAIDGKPMHLARNLMLDAAMFEWAVRTGQRRVLYLSSSAAYPVHLQRRETDIDKVARRLLGSTDRRLREDMIGFGEMVGTPDAHYGWAKLTGERMAAGANEAGVPTHIVRAFSGYGEDQSLNFPFPAIVDRARRGDLSVWGPPGQTRDWIHIDDVIAGALAVVDAGDTRPVNLCTGIGTEMGGLALLVARQGGLHPGEVKYIEDRPTGVMYRVGDPARMNEHYTPKISIEEGVRRALA